METTSGAEQILRAAARGSVPEARTVLAWLGAKFQFKFAHELFEEKEIESDAGVLTLDFQRHPSNQITLIENISSVPFPEYADSGKTYILVVIQDATGGRVISGWDANFLWPEGASPTLSPDANGVDLISFYCTSISGTKKMIGTQLPDAQVAV